MQGECAVQQGYWTGPDNSCDPDPCPTAGITMLGSHGGEGLIGASPNPFTGSTTIWYRLARTGQVRLEIFDASGSRLSSFELGVMDAGVHWLEWDGRALGGNPVAPGVCFARLTAGDRRWTRSIIRIQ
jgi:hypothetical protein